MHYSKATTFGGGHLLTYLFINLQSSAAPAQAITDILVRLPLGLPTWLPTVTRIGFGLKRARLIAGPDCQAHPFTLGVGFLNQFFFGVASGSMTSTTPSFRLRSTLPVSHQLASFCQLKPLACNTTQIV